MLDISLYHLTRKRKIPEHVGPFESSDGPNGSDEWFKKNGFQFELGVWTKICTDAFQIGEKKVEPGCIMASVHPVISGEKISLVV